MEQPTDAVAASSPAQTHDLSTFSEAELASWRETGHYPEATSPAEIDAAKPAEQVAPTGVVEKAASEPAANPKTEQRFQELLADRAAQRDRADRLERELAALRAPAKPADATPAVSSPAPATDPEPNPDDATKYPDGIYDRKFIKDQAAWEAREVLRVRDAESATQRQTAHREAEEHRVNTAWAERVKEGRQAHTDFDAVAFGPTTIEAGSPMDVWIMGSKYGGEVLYALQKNPAEQRRIAALPVIEQLEALVELGLSVKPGTVAPVVAKTITDAPDPPRTLGSKSTIVGDEEAAALKNNDWEKLRDLRNARDLARIRS